MLLAVAVCAPVARAADMFWIPPDDWGVWNYRTTSSWIDSTGASGSDGPVVSTIEYLPVDYTIKDHQAKYARPDPGGTLPVDGNHYLMQDAVGDLYRISDGNPNKNQWFEYYDNPSPFMTHDLFSVGQSKTYSGNWSGQWENHDGSYEPWTGTWTSEFTNLGREGITTPLGTFDALKFEIIDTNTKSPVSDPTQSNTSVATAYAWIATIDGHVAPLQISEHWRDETHTSGALTGWSEEDILTQAVSAVPLPSAFWLLGSGLLGLIGIAGRRGTV